jgi:uncharacterized protein YhfF
MQKYGQIVLVLLLVLVGIKTASCSRYTDYERDGEPLPKQGNIEVLVDGSGTPVAIIEIVDVFLSPFNEVPDWFAYAESEGDRSLSHWREVHRKFFSVDWPANEPFSENLRLVCEQFRVLHQFPANNERS